MCIRDRLSPVEFGGMTCVFITREGRSIALASQLDNVGLEQTQTYDEVVCYGLDFEKGFADMMQRLAPKTIALNYSCLLYTSPRRRPDDRPLL